MFSAKKFSVPAVSLLAVALAGALTSCSSDSDFDSDVEDAVDDYLGLLEAGDIDAALDLAEGTIEWELASPEFLQEGVLDPEWSYEVAQGWMSGDDYAVVEYEISNDPQSATIGMFELAKTDGDWEILNPLVRISTQGTPLSYVEIADQSTEEDMFWLFPGAYEFYPSFTTEHILSSPEIFEAATYPVANTSQEQADAAGYRYTEINASVFDRRAMEELVNDHFPDLSEVCASVDSLESDTCPLSLGVEEDVPFQISTEEIEPDSIEEIRWDIDTVPVLHVGTTSRTEFSVSEDGVVWVEIIDDQGEEHSSRCQIDHAEGEIGIIGPNDIELHFDELHANC